VRRLEGEREKVGGEVWRDRKRVKEVKDIVRCWEGRKKASVYFVE
jgi:hypothetical protein